jgi:hypothetical protein
MTGSPGDTPSQSKQQLAMIVGFLFDKISNLAKLDKKTEPKNPASRNNFYA